LLAPAPSSTRVQTRRVKRPNGGGPDIEEGAGASKETPRLTVGYWLRLPSSLCLDGRTLCTTSGVWNSVGCTKRRGRAYFCRSLDMSGTGESNGTELGENLNDESKETVANNTVSHGGVPLKRSKYDQPSSALATQDAPSHVTTVSNNTIVLKNLPFDLEADVLRVLTEDLNLDKPVKRVHLHCDPDTGRFRGIAFLTFHKKADAKKAFEFFQERQFNGRKVRVEYRYARRDEDEGNTSETTVDKRAEFFSKRKASVRSEWKEKHTKILSDFLERDGEQELVLEELLSPKERAIFHELAESLGLGHKSYEDEQGQRRLHVTKDPELKEKWKQEFEKAKLDASDKKKELAIAKKEAAVKATLEGITRINWFTPRAQRKASAGDGDPDERINLTILSEVLEASGSFLPVPARRQPKGPDGPGFLKRIAAHALSKITLSQEEDEEGETAIPLDVETILLEPRKVSTENAEV